jgi:hypothetical protein
MLVLWLIFPGDILKHLAGQCQRPFHPNSFHLLLHSADSILYTVTQDSVLRIFLPVLDSPHLLQLHASLDLFSSLPFSVASNHPESPSSSVFWMDKGVLGNALKHTLNSRPKEEDARSRRIAEIQEEEWDLFLRVLADGSIIVTAVAVSNHLPSCTIVSTKGPRI